MKAEVLHRQYGKSRMSRCTKNVAGAMNILKSSLCRASVGLIGLLLLLLLQSTPVGASTRNDPWRPFDTPWFDKAGNTEGLPPAIVTSIVQDQHGLIWVGTMMGLARYDGYHAQIFDSRSNSNGGQRLPDAYIRCLLTLPDGDVLIGTNAGGLVRFVQASNSFRIYPVGANGTPGRQIYALADDHAGGIWIATDQGLGHLDSHTNQISQLKTDAATAPRNFSVMQDHVGNVWLGNSDGLFVRRASSNIFVRPESPGGTVAKVLADQIWAVHEDSEGRLWVGSLHSGTVYLDTKRQWHVVPDSSNHERTARQSTVRDFLEVSSGTMWIATDGSGIISYSSSDEQPHPIDHDVAIASSLPGDSVRALLQDRTGNIWAATDLGLARTDPNARTAFSILPSAREQNALSNTSVRSIYVDGRGRIWLGLESGRIDLIDLKVGRMQHLRLGGEQVNSDVQAFVEAADGSIWVGTQGLAQINPDTRVITHSAVPALKDEPVLSLQRDGNLLLIGTYAGLYRYNTRTHVLNHVGHDPKDPASLASDTVRQIASVGETWWYGTTHGISIAARSLDDRHFVNLQHEGVNPSSLPQGNISAITLDPKGHLWVGTFGGLGVIDRYLPGGPYRFRTIDTSYGLPSDEVSSVLNDDEGRAWVSTSNGVAMVDDSTYEVKNLGIRDGLHIFGYVYHAAARAPDGALLFGGLGGLTVIRPYRQLPAMTTAPLSLTSVIANDAVLPFGKLPGSGDVINLDSRSRNLHVSFALLDYRASMETSYSYRMEGLEEEWVDVPKGSLPSAIYINLPQGEYRLRLRAVVHGMQTHTVESDFGILVKPRWYETVTSRIIAVLLLIACVAGLVQLRTLYLRRQARQLERQVEERTYALRVANQHLDKLANTDGLTGAYNRRRFMELVRSERELAADNATCMALFDLDHFKLINDTYGHQAGDAVICSVIDVIRQHCRQGDLVGRYGGEEFVLCLPDTGLLHALETAERIRKTLAGAVLMHDGQMISATISVGVAELRKGESVEQWLSRVDKALYEAKRSGRNRSIGSN